MRNAKKSRWLVSLGFALIGALTTSCEEEKAESTVPPPSAPPSAVPSERAAFVHVELALDESVDENVARHAREAYRRGLTPIVHSRTPWNTASTLGRDLADPRVRAELEGIYLIELDYNDACIEDRDSRPVCSEQWSSLICGTYANMLMVAGPNGEKTRMKGSPGKSGPTTPAENARMLRSFRLLMEMVQRGEDIGNCAFLEHDEPAVPPPP